MAGKKRPNAMPSVMTAVIYIPGLFLAGFALSKNAFLFAGIVVVFNWAVANQASGADTIRMLRALIDGGRDKLLNATTPPLPLGDGDDDENDNKETPK